MKNLNEEAKAFMIWRAAQAVEWDCTVPELAQETGIHAATVARIVKKRGWRKRLTKPLGYGKAFVERPSVDRIMTKLHWAKFE